MRDDLLDLIIDVVELIAIKGNNFTIDELITIKENSNFKGSSIAI
jgi:hypothetical protein